MFSEGALRLAGLAGALFGWRPAEFWGATPAELLAIARAVAPQSEGTIEQAELARLKEMFPDG